MFETRDALLRSLSAIMLEELDLPVPDDQRDGVLARIFGAKSTEPGGGATPFPPDLAQKIADLARPGCALKNDDTLNEANAPLGASKIGGCPDLPAGMAWPTRPAWTDDASGYRNDMTAPDSKWSWATPEQCDSFRAMAGRMADYVENEAPLAFFAQINFADFAASGALAALPELPQTGILYLFYDYFEQAWGFDPKDAAGFQLVYVETPADLARTAIPDQLANLLDDGTIAPRYVTAKPEYFCPGGSQPEIRALDLPQDVHEALFLWFDTFWEDNGVPDHHLMGWPFLIQNPMETECALVSSGHYCGNADAYHDPALADLIATSSDWVLLLQIDSDEDAGFMFGDSGILYVWIRKQDLAARAFDKAWVVLQCS